MNNLSVVQSNEQVYGFIYNNTELFTEAIEAPEAELNVIDYIYSTPTEAPVSDAAYINDTEYYISVAQF